MIKLTPEQTLQLQEQHYKAAEAELESQKSAIDLKVLRNVVLKGHKAFGGAFNSDYTEIKVPDKKETG